MDFDIKDFGQRIQQLRRACGMTQSALAEELNITRSYVSNLEAGKKRCSPDLIVELANVFGVTSDYLLLGIGPVSYNFDDVMEDLLDDLKAIENKIYQCFHRERDVSTKVHTN